MTMTMMMMTMMMIQICHTHLFLEIHLVTSLRPELQMNLKRSSFSLNSPNEQFSQILYQPRF